MVAAFEFLDWQIKAEEELTNRAEDGAYCNLLRVLRLCERVRVWNNASQDRREDALAAFDGEDDDDDGRSSSRRRRIQVVVVVGAAVV